MAQSYLCLSAHISVTNRSHSGSRILEYKMIKDIVCNKYENKAKHDHHPAIQIHMAAALLF